MHLYYYSFILNYNVQVAKSNELLYTIIMLKADTLYFLTSWFIRRYSVDCAITNSCVSLYIHTLTKFLIYQILGQWFFELQDYSALGERPQYLQNSDYINQKRNTHCSSIFCTYAKNTNTEFQKLSNFTKNLGRDQ